MDIDREEMTEAFKTIVVMAFIAAVAMIVWFATNDPFYG